MKPLSLILPMVSAALVVGCQSNSHSSKTSAANSGATTAQANASSASTTAPAQKISLPTIRINAGGAALKDSTGVDWLADTGFEGGDVIERPDLQIANTRQPEIYRSEHYAMDAFKQPLPNGKYIVKLHFAETFEGIQGAGERVFSFDVEGKAFANFDPFVKAGGFAKAYVETVPVAIADGVLNIKFTPQMENPQICGIEVTPAP
jgi:endoglucanase